MNNILMGRPNEGDRGKAYKRAILKRKLMDARKKSKLLDKHNSIAAHSNVPHQEFNKSLFTYCNKYSSFHTVSLRKPIMRNYHNQITEKNKNTKMISSLNNNDNNKPTPQKHVLDEVGHVKNFDKTDENRIQLERNLKKVATLGIVQLFNAINQCRSNLKKGMDNQPNKENNDSNKIDDNINPSNKHPIMSDNIPSNNSQNTFRNSLMEALRRRTKIFSNSSHQEQKN